MKARLAGLSLVSALLIGCYPEAKLPAPVYSPSTPLVEYSTDGGESWQDLKKDEAVRLDTTEVQIRRTKEGAAFKVQVQPDFKGLFLSLFNGSVTRADEMIMVEGEGAISIFIDDRHYAKLILG